MTEGRRAEWASLYPGVDVLGECRKALAYVRANSPKTAKGMPRFLVNWLNRSANGHRGAFAPPAKPLFGDWRPK